jgi:putative peptide modification system cyclase
LQEHDQFLRHCLSLTQGRLIDKADGVLALFERPIQALDFSLRYQQQMRAWSKQYQHSIQARIGIHVGDVMTWQNEPDQINAGAKPLEVEGMAKPIAARLMGLAMPGQILMSGMAQSLAQRAQLELGERGQHLRWLVHGRYQFKGVPAPMLVHEVGDPEFSPLRAPVSTQKAWRDIPFWRRPPVVALEVLLSIGLIGGFLYSTFQSPPAIAFYERDWVVLGDLQNQTQEKMFNDSLDTAIRIGLEQSTYVNVISDNQKKTALEMMQRKDAKLDRLNSAEVALRTNAKAFVLPTLSQVGGKLRISAEVIDPNTGVTIYSESADAKSVDDVLDATDVVLTNIRKRLGESLPKIQKSTKPLEQVTTKNLEALRAYSLAREAKRESRFNDAKLLYEQAVKNDPEFALAYNGLASISYISADSVEFEKYLQLTKENRSHLTNRESLLLDATEAILESPSSSLVKWKLLGRLYPDEFRAHYNYAYYAYAEGKTDAETLSIIDAAIKPQNPAIANAYYLKGLILLHRNEYKLSLEAFNLAENNGIRGNKTDHVIAYLANDDYKNADRIFKSQTSSGSDVTDVDSHLSDILIPLSKGNISAGLKSAKAISEEAKKTSDPSVDSLTTAWLFSLQSNKPEKNYSSELQSYLDKQIKLISNSNAADQRRSLFNIYMIAWMAAKTGDSLLAKKSLEAAKLFPQKNIPIANHDMQLTAEAEMYLALDKSDSAISLLKDRAQKSNSLYLLNSTIEKAYRKAGKVQFADLQLKWLIENRGRAYAEYNNENYLQPQNVYTYYQATLASND